MLTHEEMVKRMLKEPSVKAEYDAQAEEFALLDAALAGATASRLNPGRSRRKDGHEDAGGSSPGVGRRE